MVRSCGKHDSDMLHKREKEKSRLGIGEVTAVALCISQVPVQQLPDTRLGLLVSDNHLLWHMLTGYKHYTLDIFYRPCEHACRDKCKRREQKQTG